MSVIGLGYTGYTQVGTCPHCGAPIYSPTVWWAHHSASSDILVRMSQQPQLDQGAIHHQI